MVAEIAPCSTKGFEFGADARVGVVGAGAMGSGIAQVAALAGHKVALQDTRSGAATAAVDSISTQIRRLAEKGKLESSVGEDAIANLQAVESLDGLSGSALVIEAIVENLEAKQSLFLALESILDKNAILATNTSSIPVTAIGAPLAHPERLAGLHFFNPAPRMPLVEVIRGAHTAREVVDLLYVTAKRWGKVPVHARATPGFIVNRVARPFYAEGLRLLDEGAADCATIDALMREAGGFRMGPFELMDLIGHDVNYAVTRTVFESYYGDQRFMPSLRQLELVEAGFLGRKSGRGFYRYIDYAGPPEPRTAEPRKAPLWPTVYRGGGLGELLAQRLEAAGHDVDLASAHADGRIADGKDFILYRTDGRTATQRATRNGFSGTLLVDLTLDDSKAKRLALAAADQAGKESVDAAIGLLQAAGYAVSLIDDVPGMAVARTVAMLANEAADAVNQGVCNARDVDLAMRNGVNYPRGPLEWATSLGIGRIVSILDNLATIYGEDRYRTSSLLRRKAWAGTDFSTGKGSA